jgi:hypothetical protein
VRVVNKAAEKFMELFHGLERAYGTYDLRKKSARGDKKILGEAVTLREPVTKQLWEDHLAGRRGLGIIPIRDDCTSYFGAIDVDIYEGLDVREVLKKINSNELPLTACRTKSGGLHLYTFLNEPTPARVVRQKLSHYAAILGYADSEIYPRQDEVLASRGDMGQWINMPYFNGDETDRYAYDDVGEGMTPDTFLKSAFHRRKTQKEFEAYTVDLLPDLSDGPPCLQLLVSRGFMAGTRNDGLYNLGIYLKRKSPDGWQSMMNDFNVRFFDPPLLASEVEALIKSLKKKDYEYSCGKSPLRPHCNSGVCRTRKFGVGALLDMPVLTALTKFDTSPPIWFVDVEGGGRLELETDDLQNQIRFQRVCLNALNVMTPVVKPAIWADIVRNLLEHVTIIEVSNDTSMAGQLTELLETYCTSMARARSIDELLIGKPWTDRGRTYFRLSDFLAYLDRKKFKGPGAHKVASMLKDRGGESEFIRLRGKGINVWSIPKFDEVQEVLEPTVEVPENHF